MSAYYVPGCVFCDTSRIAPPIERRIASNGEQIIVFTPLNPVTPGHQLVVPVRHVNDATISPRLTGAVMEVAAEVADKWPAANLITSIGEAATQTVPHLHAHVVPRHMGDDLPLPWTPQQAKEPK